MLAIRYVLEKADELNMPVVIYLGLGTNLSSHTGTSPLARQISALAYQPGIAIVVTGEMKGRPNITMRVLSQMERLWWK